MSRMEMNKYKRTKRNQNRAKVREALFIAEYLETKYQNIYMEAATMYNGLNEKHPKKPDLRRTAEFREWKNKIKPRSFGLSSKSKYEHLTYKDIKLLPLQPLTMQLEIPLLQPPNPTRQSSDDQTTNPPPTDEILQKGEQASDQQDVRNITPSLMEELSPQVIDKIIKDLQNDPYMDDLMRDVEEQIEEELLEVDVPEIPDLLEEELNRLM